VKSRELKGVCEKIQKQRQTPIVAVEFLYELDEQNRLVARVLYCTNDKYARNQIISFSKKYTITTLDNIYFISPHWITSYTPKVEICFGDSTSEVTFTKFRYITLEKFYWNFSYKDISAYNNFSRLFRRGYYYALNATCKHYEIDPEYLKKLIGKINSKKKEVKKQWYNLLKSQN